MIALTREVPTSIAECELTHVGRTPIDVSVARAEHAALERALVAAGCAVRRLPGLDALPDAVFVEDCAVVLDEIAVVTRPGVESRRAEIRTVADALAALRPVVTIDAPGTLDGGDVLHVGRTLWVGVGARSNMAGAWQLAAVVEPFGYAVRLATMRDCLHLKTAVTAIGDALLLVNPSWVDAATFGMPAIEIDPAEPFAANAMRVNGVVLHGAEFARTRRRMEAAGLVVVPVPAGELAKAEGGVTCCALLLNSRDRAG